MASSEKALLDSDLGLVSDTKETPCFLKDSKYSWLVVASGFVTQVFILGVLHAFGVFYIEFLHDFHSSKAETAWVGSIAYGLSMFFGPLASYLQNRYSKRIVMVSGGIICCASVLMTSFVRTLPQMFITFSVFYGIGASFSINPTMTIAHDYFDKYETVAVGVMTAGSSVGTLIMAPLSQALIDDIGWRNTFRCFAATSLLTSALCCVIKPLQKPNTAIQQLKQSTLKALMQELKIWKNRVFVVWTLAIACVMFGFYIPYVHLVSYAVDVGIPPEKGSMLVMLLGACTATGRIMFGKIMNFGILNRLHMHQISMVITGAGVMILPLIKSFWGIVAYVVIVGLVDGCFVVLLPLLTASLVGQENTVIAWGFLVGTGSFTFALGPAVAGALYDHTGSYNVAFHCAGIPVITGALILFLIPWAQRTSKTSNILKVVSNVDINEPCKEELNDLDMKSGRLATSHDTVIAVTDITLDKADIVSSSTQTSPHQTDDWTSITPKTFPLHDNHFEANDALCQLQNNDRVLSRMLDQKQEAYKDMGVKQGQMPFIHIKSESFHPVQTHNNVMRILSGPPALTVNIADSASGSVNNEHIRNTSSSSISLLSGSSILYCDNRPDTAHPSMFSFAPSHSENSLEPTVVLKTENISMIPETPKTPFSDFKSAQHLGLQHSANEEIDLTRKTQGLDNGTVSSLNTGDLLTDEQRKCIATEPLSENIDISETMSVSQAWQAIKNHFDSDNKSTHADMKNNNDHKMSEQANTSHDSRLSYLEPLSVNTNIDANSIIFPVPCQATADSICNNLNVLPDTSLCSVGASAISPWEVNNPEIQPENVTSSVNYTSVNNVCPELSSFSNLIGSGNVNADDLESDGQSVDYRAANQDGKADNSQLMCGSDDSIVTMTFNSAGSVSQCAESSTNSTGHIDVFSHLFKDE